MRSTYSPGWGIVVGLFAISLLGCSEAPPNMASGVVTMNGTPIEKGEIMFHPIDGKGTVAAGPIVNGAFSIECSPGEKKVSITAIKEQGLAPDGLPNYVSYIPKKYNTETTLTSKVEAGGENKFTFDLK